MLSPVEFPTFKGLDLRLDAQLVGPGAAVDLLNVDFDREGIVRTRDGTAALYTAAGTIDGISRIPGTLGYIFFGTGSNVYLIDSSGGVPASLVATTASVTFPVGRMVSLGLSPFYFIDGSSYLVRQVDVAAAVSTPGGLPAGGTCLALQTPDQRLVVGNAGGTNGKIAFSDPSAPTTFGVNNFVQLPEVVTSLVSWNDLLFAFCYSSFYVFYGNSLDSGNEPVFNYRLVSGSIGTGSVSGFGNGVADSNSDGVYFINTYGVYMTTGGPPVKISAPLDPIFDERSTPPYFVGNGSVPPASGRNALVCSGRKIFACAGSPSENGYWFVYNLDTQVWTYWRIANGWFVLPDSEIYSSLVPYESRTVLASYNGTAITYLDPGATSDNGTTITSSYRSGFWNPGKPMVESRIREWLVDGTGTPTFSVSANDAATLPTGVSLTLGTSPAVANARDRRAIRGRNFSWQLSTTSAWSASRVVANVADQRDPGTKS